jgi:hypothetical protein
MILGAELLLPPVLVRNSFLQMNFFKRKKREKKKAIKDVK